MKGVIHKRDENWGVLWSDMQDFSPGNYHQWHRLKYENQIQDFDLKDGDKVEFEILLPHYHEENYDPVFYSRVKSKLK